MAIPRIIVDFSRGEELFVGGLSGLSFSGRE